MVVGNAHSSGPQAERQAPLYKGRVDRGATVRGLVQPTEQSSGVRGPQQAMERAAGATG